MKKVLLIVLIAVVLLGVGGYAFIQYSLKNTKQYSPEETVEYQADGADISVFYNRPSKKGREIFGELVPYGEWWRTGANEPTQITLTKALEFSDGKTLPPGEYSIVTIPQADEWTVVFNGEIPMWGTIYDPGADVLRVNAPVKTLPETKEIFTIDFEQDSTQHYLTFAWDRTKVAVPFEVK